MDRNNLLPRSVCLRLLSDGYADPLPLAVIDTEMTFRTRRQRLWELAGWCILAPLACQVADMISVGIAQVQVRHWRRFGMIRPRDHLTAIARFLDPLSNYHMCTKILDELATAERSDMVHVARAYVGMAFPLYVARLQRRYVMYATIARARQTCVRDARSAMDCASTSREHVGAPFACQRLST
jgi:hypothetical protein